MTPAVSSETPLHAVQPRIDFLIMSEPVAGREDVGVVDVGAFAAGVLGAVVMVVAVLGGNVGASVEVTELDGLAGLEAAGIDEVLDPEESLDSPPQPASVSPNTNNATRGLSDPLNEASPETRPLNFHPCNLSSSTEPPSLLSEFADIPYSR